MENRIYLWYNEILEEYSFGSKEELDQMLTYYTKGSLPVHYEMDSSKISLCRRIKDRLNQVNIRMREKVR